ncbi:MAG: lipopolysaccharide kinase InaA family protein, partial [Candidatus Aenigmatarchaeota archaeon]
MMEITKDYKKVIQMDGVFFVKEYMKELDKLGLYNFDSIMNCKCGELIKDTGTRKVFRIRSSDGRIRFYLKTHRCKWGLFGFLYKDRGDGGFREWENIFNLMHAGIPTQSPVSAGLRRKGSSVESFIITENLEGYKRMEIYMVENFAVSFSQRDIRKKREIIKKTASLIRMMHDSGFCHGDLYLTHIMIKDDGNNLDLRFIDLQRLRKRTIRNIVKDLASLNFAAKSSYTTPSDRLRFIKHYLGKDR